jgi:hypothetical protein
MVLKIHGSKTVQIINLSPEFFNKHEERRGNKRQVLTPKDKAYQYGIQLLGDDYQGHILEKDGVIIQNTLEGNRNTHVGHSTATTRANISPTEESVHRNHLSGKLAKALKF